MSEDGLGRVIRECSTHPVCRLHRRITWAQVFPYFSPILFTT